MNKILLVEDNVEMAQLVVESLKSIAKVDVACFRKEVLHALTENNYDLCILDLSLPDSHGYEIHNMIRENKKSANVPVIFMTADDSESSQITGFTLGADDYIVKPIRMGAFRARILSKLKHLNKNPPPLIRFGPISIDTMSQRALVQTEGAQEKALDLTPIEFKILLSLLKNKEKVVTRQILIDDVWGKNIYIGDRVVDQHVSSLRKKLGEHQTLIHTVYGTGYRMMNEYGLTV